jgi:hypothetical protein
VGHADASRGIAESRTFDVLGRLLAGRRMLLNADPLRDVR